MNDLEPELSRLFDAARDATEPAPEDRTRIRAALAAKLASGVLLSSASANAAGAGSGVSGLLGTGWKAALLTQIGSGLLVGTLLGGGATVLVSSVTDPKPTPVDTAVTAPRIPEDFPRQPQRLPAVTSVGARDAVPPVAAPVVAARSSSHPVAGPAASANPSPVSTEVAIAGFPESKPVSVPSDLSNELAIVSRMHAAWQRGDWAGALSAITTHEQQFPHGTLVEEREAVKVMLACRSTDRARAIELGHGFLSRHPNSTHASRIGAVCGTRR